MFKKIASMDDKLKLKNYELNSVRGGGCSTYCPEINDVGGFCCRGQSGFTAYLIVHQG